MGSTIKRELLNDTDLRNIADCLKYAEKDVLIKRYIDILNCMADSMCSDDAIVVKEDYFDVQHGVS